MKVIYANQRNPDIDTPSIFLAGPTPRSKEVMSWRENALRTMKDFGFNGVVYVPEDQNGEWQHSYIDQVEWERESLDIANAILFWVPRDLETLPGFTTNVEFGRYCTSGRAVLGFPKDAPKTRYLEWLATKEGVPVFYHLNPAITYAIKKAQGLK